MRNDCNACLTRSAFHHFCRSRLQSARPTTGLAYVFEHPLTGPHYGRLERLYRSLTIERIRASRDVAGVTRAARMFDIGRHSPIPAHHGLATVFTRAEMGERLVELRNRRNGLISGRALFPRAKGPKLDPAFLTDEALNRLIQSHPDLQLVERLRTERAMRSAWQPTVLTGDRP